MQSRSVKWPLDSKCGNEIQTTWSETDIKNTPREYRERNREARVALSAESPSENIPSTRFVRPRTYVVPFGKKGRGKKAEKSPVFINKRASTVTAVALNELGNVVSLVQRDYASFQKIATSTCIVAHAKLQEANRIVCFFRERKFHVQKYRNFR